MSRDLLNILLLHLKEELFIPTTGTICMLLAMPTRKENKNSTLLAFVFGLLSKVLCKKW